MDVSKEEAAAALAAVKRANVAARSAFRAHHGHYHLWLWGIVWIAMAMTAHIRGPSGTQYFPWMSAAGLFVSYCIGFLQNRQVRAPIDRRFLGAVVTLVTFAMLMPFVLRPHAPTPEMWFAFSALIVSQAYVIAGLWFDTYMVGFGILLAALILIGLFFVTAYFWIWIAVCTGGAFLLTGFYVRYFWR